MAKKEDQNKQDPEVKTEGDTPVEGGQTESPKTDGKSEATQTSDLEASVQKMLDDVQVKVDSMLKSAQEEAQKLVGDARSEAERVRKDAKRGDAPKYLGEEVEVELDHQFMTNGVTYGPGVVKVPKVIANDLKRRNREYNTYDKERHMERNFMNQSSQSGQEV